jgi:hypothetical protein
MVKYYDTVRGGLYMIKYHNILFTMFITLFISVFSHVSEADEYEKLSDFKSLEKEISRLEERIIYQEEAEAVKRAILRYGRWVDRVMYSDKEEDFRFIANELMTEDGIVEYDSKIWGPKKKDLVDSIRASCAEVDWSIHYYMNPEVVLDLEKKTAQYRALELIVRRLDGGTAEWVWAANDAILEKINGNWKLARYRPSESGRLKHITETSDDWPDWNKAPMWIDEWP